MGNKKLLALICLVFALSVTISGMFAFLSDRDEKINIVETKTPKIEVWEAFDANEDGIINGFTSIDEFDYEADSHSNEVYGPDELTPTFEDIIPGKTYNKIVWLRNGGDVPLYAYCIIRVSTSENERSKNFKPYTYDTTLKRYVSTADYNTYDEDEYDFGKLLNVWNDKNGNGYIDPSEAYGTDWESVRTGTSYDYSYFLEKGVNATDELANDYVMYKKLLNPGECSTAVFDTVGMSRETTSFYIEVGSPIKEVTVDAYGIQDCGSLNASLYYLIKQDDPGTGDAVVEFKDNTGVIKYYYTDIEQDFGTSIGYKLVPSCDPHYNAYILSGTSSYVYPGERIYDRGVSLTEANKTYTFTACVNENVNHIVLNFKNEDGDIVDTYHVAEDQIFTIPKIDGEDVTFITTDQNGNKVSLNSGETIKALDYFHFGRTYSLDATKVSYKEITFDAGGQNLVLTLKVGSTFVVPNVFDSTYTEWHCDNAVLQTLYPGLIIDVTNELGSTYEMQ